MRASVPVIGPTMLRRLRRSRFGRLGFRSILAFAELVWRVQRERNQLKRLDSRMLKDLGLTQDLVERETSRHAFDLPEARKEDAWR